VELTFLILALGATAGLVAITYAMRPGTRAIARHGVINALIGGLIVGAVVVGIVTLFFYGKDLFGTIGLLQALTIGAVVGAAVGAGFFWLSTVVLEIGLWFRPSASWAVGAVLATPVILAAVGFGYISFNAYVAQQAQPTVVPGTVRLILDGQRLGHIDVNSAVSCALLKDGGLAIDAQPTADDGRPADIQFTMTAAGEVSVVIVANGVQAFPGKGWEPGPETTNLIGDPIRAAGTVVLTNLVPLGTDQEPDPVERWSGRLMWGCGPQ